ncbi:MULTISPECIES: ribosome hibernation-promoting factor, HPF/YfiA family [unclassified Zunongwangia]|uniref:ribosome hibernation-promoting factor, HPF/YfiA family n=1 Tax=unclassified Zunongwangia TaxID=2632541 RepID=UPI0022DE0196|nr:MULTISPECIES: ribosome-associated translation inhibitor RaiA [unclassified Zunongwangia]WBL23228.1 ribosome-associated translation inhibitor RaiA [Zunongwangia sp. HRR-M8]WBL24823.1 ribosome-associated translation inhibitor RaiA [Zunongwangia sp. HGR-M22]
MKVNVQSVNFNADQKLIDFIQKKMDKLENYYNKVVFADVFLKVQNTSDKENKITEILLSIPGEDIMVKKTCKRFEECVDECVSSLQRQLIKRKEKSKLYA